MLMAAEKSRIPMAAKVEVQTDDDATAVFKREFLRFRGYMTVKPAKETEIR